MHKLFAWQVSKVAAREYVFGSSTIQGRRPSQEDRAFGCKLPAAKGCSSKEGCSFYAVYDGHGGARAATYATEVRPTASTARAPCTACPVHRAPHEPYTASPAR